MIRMNRSRVRAQEEAVGEQGQQQSMLVPTHGASVRRVVGARLAQLHQQPLVVAAPATPKPNQSSR